jgi:elongation factor Ts
MPAITASMVAELRAKTDAPMMECKKALTEADGSMDKAEELLRVKLGSKAGKAASRITAEGVVAAWVDGATGALIEVNCETDFVSKNESFLAFTKACAELVAKNNPADVAALSAQTYAQDGFGPTLEDVRKGLIGKIGENMTIRRFKRYAGGGKLASYLHGTRIGVMVEFGGIRLLAEGGLRDTHDHGRGGPLHARVPVRVLDAAQHVHRDRHARGAALCDVFRLRARPDHLADAAVWAADGDGAAGGAGRDGGHDDQRRDARRAGAEAVRPFQRGDHAQRLGARQCGLGRDHLRQQSRPDRDHPQ